MIYTRMIGDKEEDDKEAEGGVVVCCPYIFTDDLRFFYVLFEIRYSSFLWIKSKTISVDK